MSTGCEAELHSQAGALDGVEAFVGRCLAPQFSPSSRGTRGDALIGDQSGGTRMQLPADGFIVACFPHKIKGGSAGWTRAVPCSIRSLPNRLNLRSDRRMKRDQEKRVVVLMLATLLPIEGPLWVMNNKTQSEVR
jgi:hypothetical protein